jgi:hypothetical protein
MTADRLRRYAEFQVGLDVVIDFPDGNEPTLQPTIML